MSSVLLIISTVFRVSGLFLNYNATEVHNYTIISLIQFLLKLFQGSFAKLYFLNTKSTIFIDTTKTKHYTWSKSRTLDKAEEKDKNLCLNKYSTFQLIYSNMIDTLFLYFGVPLVIYFLISKYFESQQIGDLENKPVLITGCDSGEFKDY